MNKFLQQVSWCDGVRVDGCVGSGMVRIGRRAVRYIVLSPTRTSKRAEDYISSLTHKYIQHTCPLSHSLKHPLLENSWRSPSGGTPAISARASTRWTRSRTASRRAAGACACFVCVCVCVWCIAVNRGGDACVRGAHTARPCPWRRGAESLADSFSSFSTHNRRYFFHEMDDS